MSHPDKFNPFIEIDKKDAELPVTKDEMAAAKLAAGVVSEEEHLERMALMDDPIIRTAAVKRIADKKDSSTATENRVTDKTKELEDSFAKRMIVEYQKADKFRKREIRELVLNGEFPKKIQIDKSRFVVGSFGKIGYAYRIDSINARLSLQHIFENDNVQKIISGERDLTDGVVAFGVDNFNGRQFIVFRELFQAGNRTYPFTLIMDPGAGTWKMSNNNPALIIHKILADPIIKDILFNEADEIREWMFENIIDWIGQEDWDISDLEASEEIKSLMFQAYESSYFIGVQKNVPDLPDSGIVAKTMANLPENIRKNLTWMIGGGSQSYPVGNNKMVISPNMVSSKRV